MGSVDMASDNLKREVLPTVEAENRERLARISEGLKSIIEKTKNRVALGLPLPPAIPLDDCRYMADAIDRFLSDDCGSLEQALGLRRGRDRVVDQLELAIRAYELRHSDPERYPRLMPWDEVASCLAQKDGQHDRGGDDVRHLVDRYSGAILALYRNFARMKPQAS
jgi:hypothetical protein